MDLAKKVFAKTTYFATYFHPKQEECKLLLQLESNGQDRFDSQFKLIEFAEKEYPELASADDWSKLDLEQYKKRLRKSDNGNSDMLRRIVNAKKILCIPWLLCY